jgi:hypothetical protein
VSSDSIIDLSNATVKRLLLIGKGRGYLTYDEVNEMLPADEMQDAAQAALALIPSSASRRSSKLLPGYG